MHKITGANLIVILQEQKNEKAYMAAIFVRIQLKDQKKQGILFTY